MRPIVRLAEVLVICLFFYVLMSIFSFFMANKGIDIPYAAFLHAPWQWLVKLLESGEVI